MICRYYILTILLIVSWILSHATLSAQDIVGISARYDDDYTEWILVTADEDDFDGSLQLTYGGLSRDYTDWSWELDTISGQIRQKMPRDDRVWEASSEEGHVTITRVWPGDNSEWRVSMAGHTQTIRTRHPGQADVWRLRSDDDGYYDVFTVYPGDPRDWAIEEVLDTARYPITFKIALAFIAIYQSLPR